MTPSLVTLGPSDGAHFESALALLSRTQGVGLFGAGDLAECAASPDALVLAAIEGEALLGVAIARVLAGGAHPYYAPFGAEASDLFLRHRVGSLQTMSVLERAQGRGIGQRLTRARLAWLAAQGCEVAVGISWVSGLAHTSARVFEKTGFRAVGTVAEFFAEDSLRRPFVCPVCGPPPCRCAATMYWRPLADAAEGRAPAAAGPVPRPRDAAP